MSPVPLYVDPDDVAAHLGLPLPADSRVITMTAAAEQWVIKRRHRQVAATLFDDADVYYGTILYAALLYKQRTQPQGMPGMDALGTFAEDTGAAMAQVFRLVGADPVAI